MWYLCFIRFMSPDFGSVNTTSYCPPLHTRTPPAFCAKFVARLPWQHCSSPRIAHIDPWTSLNDPASVRKKRWKNGGTCPCMCHVSPVCVCLQFSSNSATSYQTSSSVDLVLSELCSLCNMHINKISPNHEFVMWLPTLLVTHSLQSSRSVLAACHVVSVELVLTSLSSVRPPFSFYTLTTSFQGMNNWTRTQMCP